jgi:hypothetical protein
MATTRYSTSVTLCEDTSVNYELSDLLKQADPNYSAIDPARIKLYVLDSTTNKYVEVTTGFFSAVDKDTFTVDMAQLPNFNGSRRFACSAPTAPATPSSSICRSTSPR